MITTLKWYQVVLIALGVYALALAVSRAIKNQRELNALKLGMNENLCLLIKQLKKYDKEIAELKLKAEVSRMDAALALINADITLHEEKRAAILVLISKITAENPYSVYCKPCDCEKKNGDGGQVNPDLPPPPPPPDTTTKAVRNGYRDGNGRVVIINS